MNNARKANHNDDTPELLEPFLDEASEKIVSELFHQALPELAKDLPIIKYLKKASDLYSSYKLYVLRKRMKMFLNSLMSGHFSINEYEKLKHSEKEEIVDILVSELDNQTNDLQAEALGFLFVAYVEKRIDRLAFIGISHELKNTNPLVFTFGTNEISVTEKFNDQSLAIKGPVHYLPSSFYSNGTDKLLFSSSGPFFTNLGKDFYINVYLPMHKSR